MSRKKKLSLVVVLLLLAAAFLGLGVIVTNTTLESTQAEIAQESSDSGQSEGKTSGHKGDQKAAEKLIDQTVTREEIEEQVGEWNNFELDGAGCERGVYAGKFFYDNIIINSRTYDKGETFRIVTVSEQ